MKIKMKNKIYKIFVQALVMVAIVLSLAGISQVKAKASDTISLKRIYTYMPDVVVEISGKCKGDVTAKLGSQTLTVESVSKYDSQNNSQRVIVMLDASKDNDRFGEMKKALLKLVESYGDHTDVILYTYGKTTEQKLYGGESLKEIKKTIKSLKNNQSGNRTYDALTSIYDIYYQQECTYDRQYIMLFSALEEQDVGAMTAKDAKAGFVDKSIPVYAFVPKSASDGRINALASFARSTGGEASVFSKNVENKILKFKKKIDNVTIVKMSAGSNVANKTRLLTVTVDGKTATEKVALVNSKEDVTPPEVTEVSGDKSQNALVISFSENVVGADNVYNYTVTDSKDNELKLSSVEYNSSEKKAYVYAEDTIYNTTYTVKINGVYDASENKNALTYEGTVTYENMTKEKTWIQKYLWLVIGAPIAVILIVVIIIIAVKSGKKKDVAYVDNAEKIDALSRKIDQNQQDIVNEVSNIQMKQQVRTEQKIRVQGGTPGGRKIMVRINMKNRVEQRIELDVISSIIVGRSAECDLSVDDHNMSRQHFAIEEWEDGLIIFDLESSNGTYVNGHRLTGRQVLRAGDKIAAGATEFMVYMQ